MSPTLEIEGKNIDQAVQKACQQLNLSRKELKYDVLSYGSTGIFGLGRTRNARIRVRTKEESNAAAEKASVTVLRNQTTEANTDAGNRQNSTEAQTFDESTKPVEPGNSAGLGRDVLQRIVDSITDDARITVEEQAGRVLFQVQGGNSAILIGKHGQTLEAIQSLVDKVVNKQNSQRIRVQVDVGGYLQNRKKRLIRNAERLAQKCKRTRKPVSAGLLNAYDRRIVHIALKDNHSVRTRSTGDGLLRNLMILPNKADESRPQKR